MPPEPPDLAVLTARSHALRVPLPISETLTSPDSPPPALDPFSAESLSFFVHTHSTTAPPSDEAVAVSLKRPAPKPSASDKAPKNGKRQKRFVSNWTPEMDKTVRKSLAKFGWGCWARIAASGKLPKEYTAKMIANRAKSIGLNKHMFGPAIAQTRTKTHPR